MSWILVSWLGSSVGHAAFQVYVHDRSQTIDTIFHSVPQFAALTYPPSYAFILFTGATVPSLYVAPSTTIEQCIRTANGMWPNTVWSIQMVETIADSPYPFPIPVNTASTF